MSDSTSTAASGRSLVLPFLVGDGLLLAAAFLIFWQAHRPMTPAEVGAFAACVALGAWLGVWPFVLRHRAELKLAENSELAGTLAQIQQVQGVADQIAKATGQWQTVQEHANRAATMAREVSDRMSGERKEFMTFIGKAQDTERNHLRLEVEKLRRAEGDWLQVLVRLMDHVFALYSAGLRSGQQNVIQQLVMFQTACRDTARRVGLVPLAVEPGTAFDPKVHQPADTQSPVPPDAVVEATLATGFTFQGQLLRPALVALRTADPVAAEIAAEAASVMPPTLEEASTNPTTRSSSSDELGEESGPVPGPGPKPGTLAPRYPMVSPPAVKPGAEPISDNLL